MKSEREALSNDGAIQQPDSIFENVLTILRLPVERSNRLVPEWPLISGLTLALMIVLQIFVTDLSFIENFGFYPGEPLKNFGLNIFSHLFIHAGWFHLLSNCYFAFLLSDDVEDDLGSFRFVVFLTFVAIFGAVISWMISGSRNVPHVGYSGVVMALFAYYGLQFPKAKMIWLLPRMRILQLGKLDTPVLGWGWFQFRTLWVALFYLSLDAVNYFLFEAGRSASVSFSGHIAGFLAGALFWIIFAPKTFNKHTRDIFEVQMDGLVNGGPAPKRSQLQIRNSTKKEE